VLHNAPYTVRLHPLYLKGFLLNVRHRLNHDAVLERDMLRMLRKSSLASANISTFDD
ncbi:hypothetical protein EIP91_005180, partial [Steccherinum ochraceum]